MTWLRGIEAHELDAFWPLAEPLIEKALVYAPDWTTSSILEDLKQGRKQLYLTRPSCDLALVTSIEIRPRAKVLAIWACAGHMPENWEEILEGLEQWGRSLGCTAVEAAGRPGWARRLSNYKRRTVIVRKELV